MNTFCMVVIAIAGAAVMVALVIWGSIRLLRSQQEANERRQEEVGMWQRSELFTTASRQHSSVFLRCLGLAAVLFGIVPLLVSPHVNLPIRTCYYYAWLCLLTLVLLMLVFALVRYVVAKPRHDSVLLDLGVYQQLSSDTRISWVGPVFFGLFSLSAFVESDYATGALFAGLAVANSIYLVMAASARIQMTDRGIVRGCDFVTWQQIEAYELGPEEGFLVYTIRRWIPMFRIGILPVSEENREAVQQIFDHHVRRRQE